MYDPNVCDWCHRFGCSPTCPGPPDAPPCERCGAGSVLESPDPMTGCDHGRPDMVGDDRPTAAQRDAMPHV